MQTAQAHREDQVVDSGHRLPVLDGLRAISILLVLGAHMLPLGPKVLQLNWTAGAMGMSLFFALSGFLITSTLLHNPDVHAFLVRRLARIIPLAYAYAILVFTILLFDPSALFWTATFLINYFPQFMVDGYNNHFWSLCVEVHFYLAIALTVSILGKNGIWVVWPACFAITLMRVSEGAYIHIQTHLRVDEILAGACVATLYQTSWSNQRRNSVVLVAVAVALWFSAASPYAGWLQYVRPYATAAVLDRCSMLREHLGRRGPLLRSPALHCCNVLRALCGPSPDSSRVVQRGDCCRTISAQAPDQFPDDARRSPRLDVLLGAMVDRSRSKMDSTAARCVNLSLT